jgi:hypothetical protein
VAQIVFGQETQLRFDPQAGMLPGFHERQS